MHSRRFCGWRRTPLHSFQAARGEGVLPSALPLGVKCAVRLPAAGWLQSCFSAPQTQAPYLHLEEKPSKPWYKRSSFHFFGKRAANELIITAAQKGVGREEEKGPSPHCTILPLVRFPAVGGLSLLRMTAQARRLGRVHTGAVLEMVDALRPALCSGPEEGRVSASFLSLNAELSGTAGLQGAKEPPFRVMCLPPLASKRLLCQVLCFSQP